MSHVSTDALIQHLGLSAPLLLAPMAGVADATLAIAVSRAGGLGAIPAATLAPDQIRHEVGRYRGAVSTPLNLNFFAHKDVPPSSDAIARWHSALAPLHAELGLELLGAVQAGRRPFDEETATLVDELRPEVVSFHFGLPEERLLERVRATGAVILSTATTVAEARWLAERGVDAVIAQGWEAGGHRGMFLQTDVDAQVGLISLVPQIVDAVAVPVIAAGGIGDARGMRAALALGASAVQVGTAFLRSPEALTPPFHRQALARASDTDTRLTNVFTGRPARGLLNTLVQRIGPMSRDALAFPYAGSTLSALRDLDKQQGTGHYSSLWAGQSAPLAGADSAFAIARRIAAG
ncbi:MAG TPA: nitronate monooxygenase [Pseudoxanthomonas sp.]|nr:nitronate monooxygenase [Pseudoxanthomonas sp.]